MTNIFFTIRKRLKLTDFELPDWMNPKVCIKNVLDELAPTAEVKDLMQSNIEINPNPIRYSTEIISLYKETNE